MTITDISVLAGLVFFIILGFRDGFFRRIFGLMGFLAGFVLATKFMSPLGDSINEVSGFSKEISHILGFLSIFLAVVLIEILFYRWVGKTRGEELKVLSRLAGGILGAIQGCMVVSLVLILLSIYDLPSEKDRQGSYSYHRIYHFAPIVFNRFTSWMPESKAFFDQLKQDFQNLKISH